MARNKKQQAPVLSNLSIQYFRGIADQQNIDFNKKGKVVARFEPTESIDNIAKQIEELLK